MKDSAIKRIGLAVIVAAGICGAASAGPLSPDSVRSHAVRTGVSSDTFLSFQIGYSYTFPELERTGTRISVYGVFAFPLFLPSMGGGFDTLSFTAGTDIEIVRTGAFALFADAGIFVSTHSNVLGTFTPLGVTVGLYPALRFDRWYVGAGARLRLPVLLHIDHSAYVDETFSDLPGSPEAAADGWYACPGISVKTGLLGFFTIGKRLFLTSEIGFIWYPSPLTGVFDAMMIGQIPFYLDLGMGCTF